MFRKARANNKISQKPFLAHVKLFVGAGDLGSKVGVFQGMENLPGGS